MLDTQQLEAPIDAPRRTARIVDSGAASDAGIESRRDDLTEKLRLFCGPHAQPFMRYYERKYLDRGNRLNFGWSWPAFLFWIPWMFYRKLYLVGTLLIVLPVVMGVFLPNWASVPLSGIAIMIFCGLTGKRGYIEHALRKIRKIEAAGFPAEECTARIKRAGGVSYLTAVVATSFWLFFASLPILIKQFAG